MIIFITVIIIIVIIVVTIMLPGICWLPSQVGPYILCLYLP